MAAVAVERSSYYDGDGRCWGDPDPPASPGAALAPGYDVVAHLRRGHRLDVYDAWSTVRGVRCVLKTLRPDRADDATAARRLRSEGRLLARLTHPNLVRAYETVTTSTRPRPAVVLESLPGHTLHALIGDVGRLGVGDVAVLGMQLTAVLGYLHRHGWLHLDVKPGNIVAAGGRAVLLDLSVAGRAGRRSGGGTVDYQAPEQARGGVVTAAADVWGLGVTCYEALTAATPWAGAHHRDGGPDGRRRHPQCEARAERVRTRRRVPRAVGDLVDACLEPAPADRPTVAEVGAGLAAWAGFDPRTVGAGE